MSCYLRENQVSVSNFYSESIQCHMIISMEISPKVIIQFTGEISLVFYTCFILMVQSWMLIKGR